MTAKKAEKTNYKRCPLLKITKKEYTYNEKGEIVGETVTEELNDCYKHFCMAWHRGNQCCTYFDAAQAEAEE